MANTAELVANVQDLLGKELNINMYLITRTGSKRSGFIYECYSPQINQALNREIVTTVTPYLINCINGKELVQFDPSSFEADTLETVNVRDIPELHSICARIHDITDLLTSIEGIDFDKLIGYCLKLSHDQDSLYLFKKLSGTALLGKKGLQLIWGDGVLNKLTQQLFVLDERIDVLVYGDTAYILNRYYFENLFSYKDEYRAIMDRALCEIQGLDIIDGFEEFEDACHSNGRVAKRFVKTVNEGFTTLQTNKDRLPGIIEEYSLNTKFEDGKIIYGDKSNLEDIVKLLTNMLGARALDDSKGEFHGFKSRTT